MRRLLPGSGDQIETTGEWQGPAEVLVEDDFDTASSRTIVSLTVNGEKLQVYFATSAPSLKCGDILRVHGMRLGRLIGADTANAAVTAAASSCSPMGDQKIAVLLVNFGTTAVLPGYIDPPFISPMFFGSTDHSVDGYWREASYGRTSASGVVSGPYTISSTLTCSDMFGISNAAIAAADPFVDFSVYNRVFVVMPRVGGNCHLGLSTVGCTSLFSPTKGYIQGSISWLSADGMGANDAGVQLAVHEGGHGLGLGHASTLGFGSQPLGAIGVPGTHDEYGDRYSDMGIGLYYGGYYIGHYAAPHKSMLGWFAPGNVQNVSSPGTFLLQPYEPTTTGLQAIRVRRGLNGTNWLWIEYRQPLGYDASFQPYGNQPFTGALIHYDPPTYPGYTALLAFNPSVPSDFTRPALPAGSTWQDPYSELSLTVNSATPAGLSITVGYQGSPALSVSKSHVGNFSQGQAGAAYAITVSNGAGGGTTAGTVAVTDSVPAGLTLVSLSGTGWLCSSNSCSRSDPLAGGTSYPAISAVVNVASNASSPLVNQVSVSLGGSVVASSSDSTTITSAASGVPDTIVSPSPGWTLSDPPVTFCWTNNGNYLHWLDVGTGPGLGDLYGGYVPAGTNCKAVSNIPGNGGPVYARIYTYISGSLQTVAGSSATYTAPLHTFSPPDGSTFSGTSIAFSWAPVAGASYYWLDVGPFQGNGSIFAGQVNGTVQVVGNVPSTHVPIWARLWAFYGGSLHLQGDHLYTSCAGCASAITTPSPTVGLLSSASTQFCWTATTGADRYWLDVGTSEGSGDLYGADQGTATCRTVPNVSTSGVVHVQLITFRGTDSTRMRYRYLGGNSVAQMTSPTPNTVLSSSTVTFTWNAVPGATGYWLDVGASAGNGSYYAGYQGAATSRMVTGIPSGTVWVRLWTYFGGVQVPRDYQYTVTITASGVPDTIVSPSPGWTLSDPPVTFCWTNNGNYLHWLDVGTGPGLGDLYGGYVPAGTNCKAVSNIPGNGGPVYARIYTYISGSLQTVAGSSATYTAPLHTFSPPDGSTFSGTSIAFSWAPVAGASYYWLDVGPFQGNGSIFAGQVNGTVQVVGNVPSTHVPIWARLWAFYGGSLHLQGDHLYTSCAGCASAITTPSPTVGLLSSASTQFCWTATTGADRYWLDVGTSEGSGDLYGADQGTATCRTVPNVSTSGVVHVQLITFRGTDSTRMRYRYLGGNSVAQMTSPTPNTVLSSSTVTFTWNAVPGATGYWLDVGASAGNGSYYAGYQGAATSRMVTGIPSGTVWVRLWTYFGGVQVPRDYQYTR